MSPAHGKTLIASTTHARGFMTRDIPPTKQLPMLAPMTSAGICIYIPPLLLRLSFSYRDRPPHYHAASRVVSSLAAGLCIRQLQSQPPTPPPNLPYEDRMATLGLGWVKSKYADPIDMFKRLFRPLDSDQDLFLTPLRLPGPIPGSRPVRIVVEPSDYQMSTAWTRPLDLSMPGLGHPPIG